MNRSHVSFASAAFSLLVLALLLTSACSSDEGTKKGTPPADTLELAPFPSTKMLDATTASLVVELRGDGRLKFRGVPTGLAGLSKKVIVIPPTATVPNGSIRFLGVESKEGDDLVYSSIAVPPQVAFQKLHVKAAERTADVGSTWERPDLAPQSGTHASGAPPVRIHDSQTLTGGQSVDFFPYNADGDPDTKNDQVRVTGSLGGSIRYDFGMDVDWGDVLDLPGAVADCLYELVTGGSCSVESLLPEIKVGYGVKAEAKASLQVEGSAFAGFEKEYTLAKVTVTPFAIGPLVFFPELRIVANIEGGASSRFLVGTGASFTAGAGISFSSKTGIEVVPPSADSSFETPKAEVTAGAFARATLGPKVAIKLFDFAGPTAGIVVGGELVADAKKNPCFEVNGRGDLTMGFEIGIDLPVLGRVDLASWQKEFELFKKTVASGGCTLPPGLSTLAPGEGPDDAHFQNPTFTPWSRRIDSALESFGHVGDSLNHTQVLRALDGHYVVSSSGSSVVSKWNEEGKSIWTRRFTAPDEDLPHPELRMGRVVPLGDTAMLAFASPHHLIKIGQGGGLLWSKAFHVERGKEGGPYGDDTLQHTILSATADGKGGAFVGATIDPRPEGSKSEAWIFRVDANGKVLASKRLKTSAYALYPSAMTRIDGGVVVTGLAWEGGTLTWHGWVARIDDDGKLAWSKRIDGAIEGDAADVEPSAIVTTRTGNVVVSGRYGVYRRSFLLSLRPDGTEIWKANPWTGSNTSYMVVDGVAELPTTGFVAVGHYVRGYENEQTFAAGLDSVGRVLWIHGYRFTGENAQSKWASIRLADDGGAVVASNQSISAGANGSLWIFKARVKDGTVGITTEGQEVTDLPVANGTAGLTLVDQTIAVSDFATPLAPTKVVATDPKLTVVSQTP
ncbi:MAG: hypothetical protein U0169_27760 [Polyangiaceae bacterium]